MQRHEAAQPRAEVPATHDVYRAAKRLRNYGCRERTWMYPNVCRNVHYGNLEQMLMR